MSKILEVKIRVWETEESTIDLTSFLFLSARSLDANVFSGNKLNKEAEGESTADLQAFIRPLVRPAAYGHEVPTFKELDNLVGRAYKKRSVPCSVIYAAVQVALGGKD